MNIMNDIGVDFSSVQVNNNDFSAMPAGWYHARFSRLIKTNKDGLPLAWPNGDKYIQVEFIVTQPTQYAGRKIWANFTFWNSDTEKAEIAKSVFKGMCLNMGCTEAQVGVVQAMVNKEVAIRLIADRTNNRGEKINDVRGYRSIHSQPATVNAETNRQQSGINATPRAGASAIPPRPTTVIPPRPTAQTAQPAAQPTVNADPFAADIGDDDVPF